MHSIYLIRHGQVHNPAGLVYGHLPGFGLSPAGQRQTENTAGQLQHLDIDEIWSSPMDRATETAAILRDRLGIRPAVRVDQRLIEVRTAREGLPYRPDGPEQAEIRLGPDLPFPDALESVSSVRSRLFDLLDEVWRRPNSATVLVSHQVPIAITARAVGLSAERLPDVAEAGVVRLQHESGQWRGDVFEVQR